MKRRRSPATFPLPKKFRLGHAEIRVSTSPVLADQGYTTDTHREIVLEQGHPLADERNSFLHELVHVICEMDGLSLPKNVEERVAIALSNRLIEVLDHSPNVRRYLCQR